MLLYVLGKLERHRKEWYHYDLARRSDLGVAKRQPNTSADEYVASSLFVRMPKVPTECGGASKAQLRCLLSRSPPRVAESRGIDVLCPLHN